MVTDALCGIPLTHFVRTDRDGRVETNVVFESSTVVQGDILLAGLLNNYRIQEVGENLKSLHGTRTFNSVTVEGNLSWQNSDVTLRRLSHLFEDAVTLSSEQTLRGKTTFAYGLTVDTLLTDKWINGVDLEEILKDSLQMKNSPVELKGRKTFENEVEISHGPVNVSGRLDTLRINNITLSEFYREVVRKNSMKSISGQKTFLMGLSARKINVQGKTQDHNEQNEF